MAKKCFVCGNAADIGQVKGGEFICNDCFEPYSFNCNKCKEYKWYLNLHKGRLPYKVNRDEVGLRLGRYYCNQCVHDTLETFVNQEGMVTCVACGRVSMFKSHKGDFCQICHDAIGPCLVCKKETTNKVKLDKKKAHCCEDCRDSKNLLRCSACNSLTYFDPAKKYTNQGILCKPCEDQYAFCHQCGRLRDIDNINKHPKIGNVCGKCSGSLLTCSTCKKPSINLNLIGDDLYCIRCYAKKGRGYKEQWNYKPPQYIHHGTSMDNLFFGIENETNIKGMNEGKTAKELAEILKHFNPNLIYCKFDGSIGGQGVEHGKYGFELVSHPMTFDFFKKYKGWKNLFTKECKIDDTCGMHIHLSRGAFKTFHLFKFIKFVHDNEKFIDYIAEREPNKYTANIVGGEIVKDSKKGKKKRGPGDVYRRVKVNLCNNFTIELRFFSNVIDTYKLSKNMEFAHALYMFTRDAPRSYANELDLFLNHVKENPDIYGNLIRFLMEEPYEKFLKKQKKKPKKKEPFHVDAALANTLQQGRNAAAQQAQDQLNINRRRTLGAVQMARPGRVIWQDEEAAIEPPVFDDTQVDNDPL